MSEYEAGDWIAYEWGDLKIEQIAWVRGPAGGRYLHLMNDDKIDFDSVIGKVDPVTKEISDEVRDAYIQRRLKSVEDMAAQIVSVQPMDKEVGEAWIALYQSGKNPEQLRAEGYRPVSSIGLMWVKDERE